MMRSGAGHPGQARRRRGVGGLDHRAPGRSAAWRV